jgi:hypothetical protein
MIDAEGTFHTEWEEWRLMQVNDQLESTEFAIFDGTGDLAWRKLVAMRNGAPPPKIRNQKTVTTTIKEENDHERI